MSLPTSLFYLIYAKVFFELINVYMLDISGIVALPVVWLTSC